MRWPGFGQWSPWYFPGLGNIQTKHIHTYTSTHTQTGLWKYYTLKSFISLCQFVVYSGSFRLIVILVNAAVFMSKLLWKRTTPESLCACSGWRMAWLQPSFPLNFFRVQSQPHPARQRRSFHCAGFSGPKLTNGGSAVTVPFVILGKKWLRSNTKRTNPDTICEGPLTVGASVCTQCFYN